ncbi:Ig-like domain-containing protein [Nocardioides sp. R-C-SC26]|uniref:Ig-like domain-containing protein n=1 Tax=Nocardioides sp. R-C-SC26 TaxID=2870414 RepID=UPI001E382370|nr:Ig-like domain-containing protein [Nocardioides sp. R-C-SC26]
MPHARPAHRFDDAAVARVVRRGVALPIVAVLALLGALLSVAPAAFALPEVPVAHPVSITVAFGSSTNPVTLNVTGGTPTTVAVAASASHGSVVASGTSITYTPYPGFAGGDSFTYTATNEGGTSAPATVSVTVTAPTLSVFPSSLLPNGTQGTAYSQTFTAVGGTAPYAYGVTSGTVPFGMTLGPSGVLSGTPGAFGNFSFTLTATDSSSGNGPFTVSQSYMITIYPPPAVAPVVHAQSVSVSYNTATPITLTASNGPTSWHVATLPTKGTLSGPAPNLTYTPDAGAAGLDSFTVTAANDGGTSNVATVSVSIAPPAPTLITPANGAVVATSRPTYGGTARANATVEVFVAGSSIGSTTADPSGNWSLQQPVALTDSIRTVRAVALVEGVASVSSNSNTFTMDTVPPAAPVISTPGNFSTIDDNTPTFTGTAEAFSVVTVFAGSQALGTAVATNAGAWSFTAAGALADATYEFTATARDFAYNVSPTSATRTVTIDTAPRAFLQTSTPIIDGAGTRSPSVDLTASVDESLWSPTGATFTYEWRSSTDPSGPFYAVPGSSGSQPVDGVVTLPAATLTGGRYYVLAMSGATGLYASTVIAVPVYVGIGQAALDAPTISIPGGGPAPAVGQELTASATGVTPIGADVTYTWYRVADGGAETQVGSGATYAVTADDESQRLLVRARAAATDYAPSATGSSAATASVVEGSLSGTVTFGLATSAGSVTELYRGDVVTVSTTSASITPTVDPEDTVVYDYYLCPASYEAGDSILDCTLAPVVRISPELGLAVDLTVASSDPLMDAVIESGIVGARLVVAWSVDRAGYQTLTGNTAVATIGKRAVTGLTTPTLTGLPSAGRPKSGDVLGFTGGGTVSPADAVLARQWLADGLPIDGATGETLILTNALAGKQISLRLTAEKTFHSSQSVTSLTSAAVEGTYVTKPSATFAGAPTHAVVGDTLAVNVTQGSPSGAVPSYRWTVGGVVVTDVGGQPHDLGTFTVRPGDLDKSVGVTVTFTRTDYVTETTILSVPGLVGKGVLGTAPTVGVTGRPLVGSPLAASITGGTIPSGVVPTFVWMVNDHVVAGAVGSTFAPRFDDVFGIVSVEVTWERVGYEVVRVRASAADDVRLPAGGGSTPTNPPTDPPTDPPGDKPFPTLLDPVVTGTPQVGGLLSGSISLPDVPGVAAAYQWRVVRSDDTVEDIPGATTARLEIPAAYAGLEIVLVVTVTAPGYETTAKTFRFPEGGQTVARGELRRFAPAVRGLRGAPIAGRALRVVPGAVFGAERATSTQRASVAPAPAPAGLTMRVRWYADGVPVRGAERVVFRPGPAQIGKRIAVRVTFTAPGYQTSTRTSERTAPVRLGRLLAAPGSSSAGTKVALAAIAPGAASGYRVVIDGKRVARGVVARRAVRSGRPVSWTRSVRLPSNACGPTRVVVSWTDARGRYLTSRLGVVRVTGCS